MSESSGLPVMIDSTRSSQAVYMLGCLGGGVATFGSRAIEVLRRPNVAVDRRWSLSGLGLSGRARGRWSR